MNVPQKQSVSLQLIKDREDDLGKLLKVFNIPSDTFMQVIIQAFNKIPKLNECNPKSVVAAVVEAARLGLVPAGNQCALVPFKGNATFILGYRGVIELALRSGRVKKIDAFNVYVGDSFKYAFGLEPVLEHTPSGEVDPNKITHTYAIAVLDNGEKQFVVLTREEIDRVKAVSPAKSDGPWVTWFDEMCKKTAIKRLGKIIPQSAEMSRIYDIDEVPDAFVEPVEISHTEKPPIPDIDAQVVTFDPDTGEINGGNGSEGEITDRNNQGKASTGIPVEEPQEPTGPDTDEAERKREEKRERARLAQKKRREKEKAAKAAQQAPDAPILVKDPPEGQERVSEDTLEEINDALTNTTDMIEALAHMSRVYHVENPKDLSEKDGKTFLYYLQNLDVPM